MNVDTINVDDIINRLTELSVNDINKISISIDNILDKSTIIPNNLEEEMRLALVNELYNKYSWEELEILRKKYNF